MNYVLVHKKTGRYVARWGSAHSYTSEIDRAQIFATKSEAETNACPESEIVRELDSSVGGRAP